MVSRFSILTNLLLISAALAAQPSRLDARLRENRQSKSSNHVGLRSTDYFPANTINWAGAIWSDPYANFTTVSGTLTVPEGKDNSFVAWVGLDGVTCADVMFQAGIELKMDSTGNYVYEAFYVWYPESAVYLSDSINITGGDNITLSVTAFSANFGQVFILNLTNRQYVIREVTSNWSLCKQDAGWIVEDPSTGKNTGLAPLTNFGSVTFYNAFASNPYGILFDPSGAELWDITQNGKALTQTSASGSSVTIKYVG